MEKSTTHHVGNSKQLEAKRYAYKKISVRSTERMDGQGNQHLMMHFYVRFSAWKIPIVFTQMLILFYSGRGPQRERSSAMPHGDAPRSGRIRLQIPVRGRQGPRKDLLGKCGYRQRAVREEASELLWSQMGLENCEIRCSR